ncbi:MAG: glycosyltransferase, partial [Lachnospiraceae bacterium]|nr:glycosyltransferase [Lachnospiraceae bacterium]
MMKNAIIFGCGKIGTATYKKLKNQYCILAWSDNNGALWESKKEGIPIVQPIEIPELLKKENADVFVAVENGQEIVEQLRSLQVKNIYIWKKTFFYSADGLFPYKENTGMYYKKNKKEETHILFVSATAGIRDHKTAKAVKKTGKKVHLAYLKFSPYDIDSEYANIYEDIYSFMSIQALQDFIDNSDFDLVHSSSEPDYITALLARSNKPIIHDCHDLSSSNRTMFPEELTLEYIAHKEASGVVYPTEGLRNEAIRRFGLSWDKTYVLE